VIGPPEVIYELAQRLITLEGANDLSSNPKSDAAIRVFEKLRIVLIRFGGEDGYMALLRRAIALTRIKDPSLQDFTLSKDGSIASLEQISHETSLTLTTHLLHLMNTFIGQSLTLSLLNDVWPLEN